MDKKFPQKITSDTQTEFTVDKFGLYAISITASCEKNHDLKIEIDEQQFREIPAAKNVQTYDVPPAWNGTRLKGLKETVVFLLKLNKGEHTVKFFPKTEAMLEDFDCKIIPDYREINFNLEQQAQDGDRRPWFTFVLFNLPLKSVTAEVSVSWHWFDGDDVKLIIDNKVEENASSKLWKYWAWHASPFQIFSGSDREQKTFSQNLPQGIHYIEFWADKTPTLHQVSLDLGDFELKRTPTKDDPKWTGNFADDTDIMLLARLIFGEANGQPYEAKLWVGWSVINRSEANSWWGNKIREIILKKDQYDPFKTNDTNYYKIIDPLNFTGIRPTDIESWYECYKIAENIVGKKISNPTEATHFHGVGIDKEWFLKNVIPEGKFIKQIGDTYFYWSPN